MRSIQPPDARRLSANFNSGLSSSVLGHSSMRAAISRFRSKSRALPNIISVAAIGEKFPTVAGRGRRHDSAHHVAKNWRAGLELARQKTCHLAFAELVFRDQAGLASVRWKFFADGSHGNDIWQRPRFRPEAGNCSAHAGVPQHTRREAAVEIRAESPGIWRLDRPHRVLRTLAGRESTEPVVRAAGPFSGARLYSASKETVSTPACRNSRLAGANCESEQSET